MKPNEQESLGLAQSAIKAGNLRVAVLHAKVALQFNPHSADARFLLGKALLESGQFRNALIELEKASEFGYAKKIVLPEIATALYASGQVKQLIERFAERSLVDELGSARLTNTVAASYVWLNQPEQAKDFLARALELDPKYLPARILQARFTAGSGNVDAAIRDADLMASDEPGAADPLVLKGELLWIAKADLTGAAAAFQAALTRSASSVKAHVSLLRISLQSQDIKSYRVQHAVMKKALPNHPETLLYEVRLALVDRDVIRARQLIAPLLKFDTENSSVLEMAGEAEFIDGQLSAAESYFRKALSVMPGRNMTRLLLAETHLRLGQPDKALAVLQPLLSGQAVSAEALSVTAAAYMQAGDPGNAEKYYRLAVEAKPKQLGLQIALAQVQFAKGDSSRGFEQLEQLAVKDSGADANMALIAARFASGDYSRALVEVDALQKKLPGAAGPLYMKGQVLYQLGRGNDARQALEAALVADKAYFPATKRLAELDVSEGKISDAVRRLEQALVAHPKNAQAMIGLASARMRQGAKPAEVTKLFNDAVAADGGTIESRLALINHLIYMRQYKAAVAAAQDASTRFGGHPLATDALGRALLLSGDIGQALVAFRKNSTAQPDAVEPLMRLAEAYVVKGDVPLAKQTLNRAIEIAPQLVQAQRMLINLALSSGRTAEAISIARRVQRDRPKDPVGYLLEGQIHAGTKAWAQSAAMYKAALDRSSETDLAKKYQTILDLGGKKEEAKAFAVSWLKSNPADQEFAHHLGIMAIEQGRFADAEEIYRKILAVASDNPVANNNLAWALLKQSKPGAIQAAELANSKKPGQPEIVETLVQALVAERQWPKAITLQRELVALASESSDHRLTLSKILLESGDRVQAKLELEKIQAVGDKFSKQAEVKAMLAKL